MNCDKVESLLNDYVDMELVVDQEAEVEVHLKDCPSCRHIEVELRALVEAARALPKSIEPEANLWPHIASAINSNNVLETQATDSLVTSWYMRPFLAGALSMAAMITVVLGVWYVNQYDIGDDHSETLAGGPYWSAYLKVEGSYEEAFAELKAILEERRENFTPETRDVIDENLRIMEDSRSEIRAAFKEEPDNARLMKLLLAANSENVHILKKSIDLSY
jgi:hypothetical protein